MSKIPEHVKCWNCLVTFKVGPARAGGYGTAETTKCTQSNCGRRFWHSGHDGGRKNNSSTVGVWPEDAHRFVEVPT